MEYTIGGGLVEVTAVCLQSLLIQMLVNHAYMHNNGPYMKALLFV